MVDVVKHKSQRSESKLTPEIRGAYLYLHEKRTKRSNGTPLPNPRYDATWLIPKLHSDPAQCPNYKWLMDHCMEAANKAWGSWPAGGHWPIQDGDAPPRPKAPVPGQPIVPIDASKYLWRKGHWIIETTSNLDPGPRVAVLQNGQAIEVPAKVIAGRTMYKSGDYFIVSLHAYTFQNEKFGTNFGFEGVLWTREGDAIGSSGPRSAAQMFGGIASTMPQAAAPSLGPPMPTTGTPPLPNVMSTTAPALPVVSLRPPTALPQMAMPSLPQPPALPGMPPPMAPSAPGLPPFPGR